MDLRISIFPAVNGDDNRQNQPVTGRISELRKTYNNSATSEKKVTSELRLTANEPDESLFIGFSHDGT